MTEFLAFADLFGVTPEELLEPVEVAQNRRLQTLLREREAKKLAIRKEAESLVKINEWVRKELGALGQPSLLDDEQPDVEVLDTKTGQQLRVVLKRVTS